MIIAVILNTTRLEFLNLNYIKSIVQKIDFINH